MAFVGLFSKYLYLRPKIHFLSYWEELYGLIVFPGLSIQIAKGKIINDNTAWRWSITNRDFSKEAFGECLMGDATTYTLELKKIHLSYRKGKESTDWRTLSCYKLPRTPVEEAQYVRLKHGHCNHMRCAVCCWSLQCTFLCWPALPYKMEVKCSQDI